MYNAQSYYSWDFYSVWFIEKQHVSDCFVSRTFVVIKVN